MVKRSNLGQTGRNCGMLKKVFSIWSTPSLYNHDRGVLSSGFLSIAAHVATALLVCWLVSKTHVPTVFTRPRTFELVKIDPGADAPTAAAPRIRKATSAPLTSVPLTPVTPIPASTASPVPSVDLPADAPIPEVASTGDASSADSRTGNSAGGTEGSEIRRIGTVEELDNTNFDPIKSPRPDYPPIALKANIEGYVDVDLVLDKTGKVLSSVIIKISGHPSFGESVQKTMPTWRFPPPRIKGKSVSVKYLYRVNFSLD